MDSQALKVLLNQSLNHEMLDRIVVEALQVIPIKSNNKKLPSLKSFLVRIVRASNIQSSTLLATIPYLRRLKKKLPSGSQGLPCTRHRILVSCIIISSKFHNDSSPRNVDWVDYAGNLFSLNDINLMEKQFLNLLNYNVKISMDEFTTSLAKLLNPIKDKLYELQTIDKYVRDEREKYQAKPYSHSRSSSCEMNYTFPANNATASIPVSIPHSPQFLPSSPESVVSRNDSIMSRPSSQISMSESINSLNSIMTKPTISKSDSMSSMCSIIDPIIEFTAKKEQCELSKFLVNLKPVEISIEKGIW